MGPELCISGALARTYAYGAAGNTLAYSTVTATYNNRVRTQTLATAGTVLYACDEAG